MAAFIELRGVSGGRVIFVNVEQIRSVVPWIDGKCNVTLCGDGTDMYTVDESYEAIKQRICEAVELTPEQPRKVGRSAYELCRETSLKATMERVSGE